MCAICKDWKAKKLTSEVAYKRIAEGLKDTKDSRKIEHLMKLSDKILDDIVPVAEVNEEAEAAFWKSTHRHEEDN